jgi:hypothetical protein
MPCILALAAILQVSRDLEMLRLAREGDGAPLCGMHALGEGAALEHVGRDSWCWSAQRRRSALAIHSKRRPENDEGWLQEGRKGAVRTQGEPGGCGLQAASPPTRTAPAEAVSL